MISYNPLNYKTTDRSLRIGMSVLYQRHSMRCGMMVYGQYYGWYGFGQKCGIGYDIELDEDSPFIRLYTSSGYEKTIQLVASTPHFGGVRWWFICPVTGKRCATLYSSPIQLNFASRQAHGILYSSQLERPPSRLIRRFHNTKDRFEVPEGFSCCPKLKGMHQSTHDKRNRILAELNRRVVVDFYKSRLFRR